MFKEIQKIFPDGTLVSFEDIKKGDTIVRGGATCFGEKMTLGVSIMRAWKYVDLRVDSYCAEDCCQGDSTPAAWKVWKADDKVGFSQDVAFSNDGHNVKPWFYRLNIENPLHVNELTNDVWVESIVSLVSSSTSLEKAECGTLSENNWVFTGTVEKGNIADENFFANMHIGKLAKFEVNRGWLQALEETPEGIVSSDFAIVLEPFDDEEPFIENDAFIFKMNL